MEAKCGKNEGKELRDVAYAGRKSQDTKHTHSTHTNTHIRRLSQTNKFMCRILKESKICSPATRAGKTYTFNRLCKIKCDEKIAIKTMRYDAMMANVENGIEGERARERASA